MLHAPSQPGISTLYQLPNSLAVKGFVCPRDTFPGLRQPGILGSWVSSQSLALKGEVLAAWRMVCKGLAQEGPNPTQLSRADSTISMGHALDPAVGWRALMEGVKEHVSP